MLWMLLALTAWSGENCPDFTLLELSELLEEADTVLKTGPMPDLGEHERLTRYVTQRLACASFIIEPEPIRDLCITNALREHYRDSTWRPWMTTARRIDPDYVIPGVHPEHPLQHWEAPRRPAPTGQAVPDGVELWLDGEPLVVVRPLDAYHVIQRRDPAGLTTRFVEGPVPFPEDLLAPAPLSAEAALARRRRHVRLAGTASSVVALVGAGLAWSAASRSYEAWLTTTGDYLLPGLQQEVRTRRAVAGTLAGAGLATMTITWTYPWRER